MLESTDPGIKLFGRQIPVLSSDDLPFTVEIDSAEKQGEHEEDEEDDDGEEETEKGHEPSSEKSVESMQQDDDDPARDGQEPAKHESFPESENPKTPSIDEETVRCGASGAQEEEGCKVSPEKDQKGLKKPDKILPCPRCNSMDTKFCYYNNYNVNQPRHFCKSCQRYWTAGGTMRNVPVGAGRRKNKSSASHSYRHISISEALQAAQVDAPDGTHGIPSLKGNGTVLRFGVTGPISGSATDIPERKVLHGTRNGFHNIEDDCLSGSSVTIPSSMDEGSGTCQKQEQQPMSNLILNSFVPQVPCVPWPYSWNIPAVPGMFPPGFGIPYYLPMDLWNCTSLQAPWNAPWPFPQQEKPQSSSSGSPTLGKHAREEKEPPEHKNVLVPKTLRVNDPMEAAKSTIWATLGIKNDSVSSKGGLLKAFHPKTDDRSQVPETSPVLCANPAALSRSINFHESS